MHPARVVMHWFEDHQNQIDLLDWPSKGCDLNPIENVWASIVKSWEPENERTRRQLVQHTMASWEFLRRKPHLYNMVASMPQRLREVIEKEGYWASY